MRDSVSLILKVQDLILAIVRQDNMRAFPGYTAFPGGAIENGESHYDALIREIYEELNVDLSSYQVKDFVYLGVAMSPKFNQTRFSNHYYLLELREIPKVIPSEVEIKSFLWKRPHEFVESFNRGELLLVPPTLNLFKFLAYEILKPPYELTPIQGDIPYIEVVKGVHQYMPRSHTFPPANRTNCFLIGDILIDPSPIDENEFQKLYELIKDKNISGIMISHHHGDHHEFAPQMAKKLNVKVLISDDSHKRICDKWGENYFKDLEIHFICDGECITHWLGEEVRAIHVPGHDAGQMALAPKSNKWFFVGDLIQTVGTVVIGAPEGDMAKYFESLKKVIAINPNVLFPSHGIAVGGVHRLQETLQHREERERQVMACMEKKLTMEEMLKKIYPDLKKELIPYARATIEAHLVKLRVERKEKVKADFSS